MTGKRQTIIDVAGTGFTTLDRTYADGDLIAEALGGSCGNIVTSLAMLRWRVAPVLALGMDDTADRLIAELSEAGVETGFVRRGQDWQSPILTHKIDTSSGSHWYSFNCPETDKRLPRFRAIEEDDVCAAEDMLRNCGIFYADRLSESILRAMRVAHSSGAMVFFEPSEVENETFFNQAVSMTSILKYSAEQLGTWREERHSPTPLFTITTHGENGLEIRHGSENMWCQAIAADRLADASGSGDMVSIGLIDFLLENQYVDPMRLTLNLIKSGVVAGQRLASANCGFQGARGLFRHKGANYARDILAIHLDVE